MTLLSSIPASKATKTAYGEQHHQRPEVEPRKKLEEAPEGYAWVAAKMREHLRHADEMLQGDEACQRTDERPGASDVHTR